MHFFTPALLSLRYCTGFPELCLREQEPLSGRGHADSSASRPLSLQAMSSQLCPGLAASRRTWDQGQTCGPHWWADS